MKVDRPGNSPQVFYSSLVQSALTRIAWGPYPGEAVDRGDGNHRDRKDADRVAPRRSGHDPASRSSDLRSDR